MLPVYISYFAGGEQNSKKPWRNVRRVANEYIFYFVVAGEIFLEEDGAYAHTAEVTRAEAADYFLRMMQMEK